MKLLFLTVSAFFLIIPFLSYSQTVPDKSNSTTREDSIITSIYETVEVEAEFPGGDKAWIDFLTKNLNGQVPLDNEAPGGRYTVWAQFIVDVDGTVTDIKALTNLGYGMEAEVIRILKLAPNKWTPAIQDGKPVKAYRKQPVTFVVIDDDVEVTLNSGKDVFYIGMDNPITITAKKVKGKNISVTISQGTIEGSNGHYTVKVTKIGKAIITIYNKEKEISEYSVEVKTLPKQKN